MFFLYPRYTNGSNLFTLIKYKNNFKITKLDRNINI